MEYHNTSQPNFYFASFYKQQAAQILSITSTTNPISNLLLALQAEAVLGLKNIRVATWLIELLLKSLPLRVVDAVNVVLNFNDHASVLGDDSGEVLVVLETLGLLERHGTLLLSAAVELEGILISVDVELDTRPGGGDSGHGTLGSPVIVAELAAVDAVASV
jgi:hypothetical protein